MLFSSSVTIRNSTLDFSQNSFGFPQTSLSVSASRVDLFGCSIIGGSNQSPLCIAISGATLVNGTQLFAQDCLFTGGDCPSDSPVSASAIRMWDSSHATLRNCALDPGSTTSGFVAPPVDTIGGGTYVEIVDSERALFVESPLRSDVTVPWRFPRAMNRSST